MKKGLTGLIVGIVALGTAAAAVHTAAPVFAAPSPSPTPTIAPTPRIAPAPIAPIKVEPPAPVTIECPLQVEVEHGVKTVPGFRSISTVRDYTRRICPGTAGMFASNMSRQVSCYYCDGDRGQVVQLVAPYPEGRTHCQRVGSSYRFECR